MTARHAAPRPRRLRRVILPLLAGTAAAGLAAVVVILNPNGARAADPVGLGTAADFSVLAASTVTNTGPSVLGQDLGVSPGNTAPGFPPGTVLGETHLGDAVSLQAQNDLTVAYNDAAGRVPFTNLASELGGLTLIPGVYRIGAAQLTGQLTLDARNDPLAVWIFQIDSTLVTASNSSVIFINGSAACNVYWQVGSSATIGTGSQFVGNIMALASVTMTTGAALAGRALARTAAVTLDTNVITEPICSTPTPTPTTPTPSPTVSPTDSLTVSSTGNPTSGPTIGSAIGPTDVPTPGPKARPLPVTGDGLVPIMLGTGTTMVLAGIAVLFLFRQRTYNSNPPSLPLPPR